MTKEEILEEARVVLNKSLKKYKGIKVDSWTQPVCYRKWYEIWKPKIWMGKGVRRGIEWHKTFLLRKSL